MTTTTSLDKDLLRGTWTIDPTHSGFEFSARHAMVATVRGRFNVVRGTLTIDPDDPTRSAGEVELAAGSIDTGDDRRDGHLKSPDFLDVEQHPTLGFRTTRAAAGADPDSFRLWGELTIRGVTREVELDVQFNGTATDPYGKPRAGFEVSGAISRKDWGLVWNVPLETGGVLVGDRVRLHLDISAVKEG
jgi:polyisoprenoid-binding protein YceI